MTRDQIAEINMELIAYVGSAKSSFLEAIDEALAGNIEQAKELLKMGVEDFNVGHSAHMKLLAAFAGGEATDLDLLTVHAQCQMMSAEDFLTIANKVVSQCENK